jgi:hypothetical protein
MPGWRQVTTDVIANPETAVGWLQASRASEREMRLRDESSDTELVIVDLESILLA